MQPVTDAHDTINNMVMPTPASMHSPGTDAHDSVDHMAMQGCKDAKVGMLMVLDMWCVFKGSGLTAVCTNLRCDLPLMVSVTGA
jgi:hypothetical protein